MLSRHGFHQRATNPGDRLDDEHAVATTRAFDEACQQIVALGVRELVHHERRKEGRAIGRERHPGDITASQGRRQAEFAVGGPRFVERPLAAIDSEHAPRRRRRGQRRRPQRRFRSPDRRSVLRDVLQSATLRAISSTTRKCKRSVKESKRRALARAGQALRPSRASSVVQRTWTTGREAPSTLLQRSARTDAAFRGRPASFEVQSRALLSLTNRYPDCLRPPLRLEVFR